RGIDLVDEELARLRGRARRSGGRNRLRLPGGGVRDRCCRTGRSARTADLASRAGDVRIVALEIVILRRARREPCRDEHAEHDYGGSHCADLRVLRAERSRPSASANAPAIPVLDELRPAVSHKQPLLLSSLGVPVPSLLLPIGLPNASVPPCG